ASGWPTGASTGSSSRPEASASMPSSFAEHSMPDDSTPRSFAALIATPPGRSPSAPEAMDGREGPPGSVAPTIASGTLMPTRALGAPQTICSGSPCPTSTLHTCSRSASGCFSAATISATTTPARSSPSGVSSSTSSPAMVSAWASWARSALISTSSRSQFSENFMLVYSWMRSSELLEETQVVLEERAQIGNTVAQHREALHAEAEGEAGVALRVDAAVPQHVRMDHAAAEHFQPAGRTVRGVPADVHFGRRLGEREIAGAEAHLEIALEERADELGQRALEVGETGSLVDQQALDLVEHRRVGLVRIAAIDLARRDDADRRLAPGHRTDLHRRGMRAQQASVAEVEGVVHGARRMMRREIQRLEIVPVILDLRAVGTLVTQPREDRRDALQRASDRVDAAAFAVAPGQADVELLRSQSALELGLFQHLLARGQCIGETLLDPVHLGTARLALVRRQCAERLQRRGDDAALAQQAHAQRVERLQRVGLVDFGQRLRGAAVQIIHRYDPDRAKVMVADRLPVGPAQAKTGRRRRPPPRLLYIISC